MKLIYSVDEINHCSVSKNARGQRKAKTGGKENEVVVASFISILTLLFCLHTTFCHPRL